MKSTYFFFGKMIVLILNVFVIVKFMNMTCLPLFDVDLI